MPFELTIPTEDPFSLLIILLWIASSFLESLSLALRLFLGRINTGKKLQVAFRVCFTLTIVATFYWVMMNQGFLVLHLKQLIGAT